MRPILICMILTLMPLASCGPAIHPQPTPDIFATSQAASATRLTTVQPTSTLPPTDRPTLLALPTNTPTRTKTPRIRATKTTYVPFIGCFTPTGTTNFTAPFKIENLIPNKVSVFINGTTKTGEHPVNCSYSLWGHTDVIFTIWWGNYTYLVQVSGKTTYQGSFWVNDVDKATMQVTKKGIKIGPFP